MESVFVNFKTQNVRDNLPANMEDYQQVYFECNHPSVGLHSRLYAMETRECPAEYIETGICNICGESMDGDDIPEYANIT